MALLPSPAPGSVRPVETRLNDEAEVSSCCRMLQQRIQPEWTDFVGAKQDQSEPYRR